MAIKLVKLGVAAIPGIVDVVEERLEVDPTYIHMTRIGEFGAGFLGSLMVAEESAWEEPLEALMLSAMPLAIKSVANLFTGALEGAPVTKEAIQLKLRRAGQVIPPVRPEEVAVEF